jgi:hypothetical protein
VNTRSQTFEAGARSSAMYDATMSNNSNRCGRLLESRERISETQMRINSVQGSAKHTLLRNRWKNK